MRPPCAPFWLRVAGLACLAAFSMGPASPAAAQGPVGAWGFGEGSGAVVSDSSGYANHGSISGAVWNTGKYGSALVFNGSAKVSVADSASLDLSTGMTLEAWVFPTSTASAWKDVIYKSVDKYYLEGSSTTGGMPAAGGTFGAPLYGAKALPVFNWSHLATTYDGATLRLYLNGVQVASRAQTGAIQASAGNLSIGGNTDFPQYWVGRIDEVRIYNRALSASEIQTDMSTPIPQAPVVVPPPVTPPATGVTLRWQQPAGSAPVDEFRVYKGPVVDDQGELMYANLPTPDAQGVYSASVQIDEIAQGTPVYVWLTAANASGESPPSNAKFYSGGCDSATDADCDQVADSDDNCPYAPNPGQEDGGGVNNLLPDGVGDACQCGDVNGDGLVTSSDAVIMKRALATPPRAVMAHPELCDVGGSAGCSGGDAVILQRALVTPPRATLVEQCAPALMP